MIAHAVRARGRGAPPNRAPPSGSRASRATASSDADAADVIRRALEEMLI